MATAMNMAISIPQHMLSIIIATCWLFPLGVRVVVWTVSSAEIIFRHLSLSPITAVT